MLLDAREAQQSVAASPGPSFTPGRSCLGLKFLFKGPLRGCCGCLPTELRAVDPHAVQDHCQLARHGNHRPSVASCLGESNPPTP